MSVALESVVVVDLTVSFWAGLAAALLGDFGADVLRMVPLGATGGRDRSGEQPSAGSGGQPSGGSGDEPSAGSGGKRSPGSSEAPSPGSDEQPSGGQGDEPSAGSGGKRPPGSNEAPSPRSGGHPSGGLSGDPSTISAGAPSAHSWNYRFELANRNKRSIALNLDTASGREIAQRLVAKSDAVLTDRPRAELQRWGLDYETLASLKPDIVYGRGSGFGPNGPDRNLPALDELAAAHTGMMPILTQPGQPPVYPGHGQMYTTILLALGAATALYHRRETGQGQLVDTSLLAGNMYAASLDLQAYLAIGGERFLHPVSRLDAGNPMSGTLYPTKDGRWVTLTMPDTDRWWPGLAEVVGLQAEDPRFNSHEKRCETNRIELLSLLDQVFRKHPAAHWRKIFSERQMSADVIEDYCYPAGDRQARRNRYLVELEDPSLGRLRMIGFPIFMTDTPAHLYRNAPRRGQHCAEVLHELLGCSVQEITELADEGVILR